MREQDEDAVWRSIVDNYGERATIDDDPGETAVAGPAIAEVEAEVEEPEPEDPQVAPSGPSLDDEPDVPPYSAILDAPEDGFVPPPPPPLPRPRGPLGLAWLGLLGSPVLLLFFVLTGTYVPQLISWALVGGFLAGFIYLVWHLPSGPRDPYDDGARI